VKHWTSYIGQCALYCTAASQWPSKWSAKLVHFIIVVLFAAALAAARAIRSESLPDGGIQWLLVLPLDMLHWAMLSVSDRRTTATAIEMASDGGTFVSCCHLFSLIKL
jgi:hypothetical protein